MEASFDGINFGKNAGRICWAVAGTCCGGKVQGTFAEKRKSCTTCDFCQTVRQQEGESSEKQKLRKFENQIIINRYVEEKVLTGISNDIEKRQQYSDWFNNARLLAKVVYYDRELETIAKASSSASGCGSSCARQ